VRSLVATLLPFALLVSGSAIAAPSSPTKAEAREALKRALVEAIQRSPLKNARVSIQIQSLADGSVVFAQNPDELLNPASNVKMVTAAAATVLLGLDYRFETEFLTDTELKNGKAAVLYVRGKGDPSITTERLFQMVSDVLHTGLREVGDLVIDESWFDGERTPPGYDQEDTDRAYMAPTGAVSLNWNTIGVYMRPSERIGGKAIVELEPHSDYFIVENDLITGRRQQQRFTVASDLEKDKQKQRIRVKGMVSSDRTSLGMWRKIDNPPQYFGQTLKELLAQRGVKVKGKVKLGLTPTTAKSLHLAQSDTLDVLLKRMNKHSSNFVAEQFLKAVGAQARGAPGSFAKGIDATEEFLEREVGIPRGSYVMKNGSGLNDTNRFSAAQMNRLLRYMFERMAYSPEYLSAVGIAGKDGTLKYRFDGSEAVGRLRAKTGTLENVSALSGYVQSVGGEPFVFSVMVNDFLGGASKVVQHIDALGAAVAATGSAQGPQNAAVAMVSPATQVGAINDVRSRVKTYLTLAKQHDRRNVPFLRTAWRSERDPAVRAVVAESLFLSDPQDSYGARLLLDSFTATEDVYGRLRIISKELGAEMPGVPSIVELAAGGNVEAMTRLIELCRVALREVDGQTEVALALSEVSRTAPSELLLVLKAAADPDRTAALTLLARGMVKAADSDHPFWPALRRTMGAVDGELAAFAKQTESALSLKIAEEKAPKPAEINEPRPGG
jgi:D-alanyl-D-alanine carboxypeptidase/D-alanyl-D-alanine-endopeptidase (penicillin-binding protein 4)